MYESYTIPTSLKAQWRDPRDVSKLMMQSFCEKIMACVNKYHIWAAIGEQIG